MTVWMSLHNWPLMGEHSFIGLDNYRAILRDTTRESVMILMIIAAAVLMALMIGVSAMIHSFRLTVDLWLEQTVKADLIVAPPALPVVAPPAAPPALRPNPLPAPAPAPVPAGAAPSPDPAAGQDQQANITPTSGRVIQQVNDYQREVFNGDVGTITSIDLEEQELVVQFTERAVTYDYADLAELALAWAVTVHKSQGSEFGHVLLVLPPHPSPVLTRELIYTGLTRAKDRLTWWVPKPSVLLAACDVRVARSGGLAE